MTRLIIACMILIAAALLVQGEAHGQEATPTIAADAGDECDVEPRTDEELSSLAATASAATPVETAVPAPEALPSGEAVDAATLTALDDTLRLAVACWTGGDADRLLALYSDRYVATIALAPEPVPIVPGQPRETLPVPGTPRPAETERVVPRVTEAVRTADGRIAAAVSGEGGSEIVWFVQERGRWVVDDVRPALPEGTIAADLPLPVQAAVAAAAGAIGVGPEAVSVVSFEAVEWPDTSLGCPKEGEMYAAVITPGYRVLLEANGQQLEYHTDETDRAVTCDQS